MSPEEQKDLIRRQIEEVWNRRNRNALKRYVSDELFRETIGHVDQLLAAFPDVEVEIEDLFAGENDRVVARLLISGTHSAADFAGVPARGTHASWRSIRIYQLAGGKIVKTWAMQDRLALLEQLGVVRTPDVNWAAGVPSGREPGEVR